MCLRSVGWFSRTKRRPASAATSRKRMGGGGRTAAARAALLMRRTDLRFTRGLLLLFLVFFQDLLVLCHGGTRFGRITRGLVCPRQLVVQAPVVIQFEGLFQVGNRIGV